MANKPTPKIVMREDGWAELNGAYRVSREGTITSLPRVVPGRWGTMKITGKTLAQFNDKNGYKLATMASLGWTKNGQVRVHRLVALCFIGPCPAGREVNHIDGDKTNNHIDNLEYVTSSENKRHAVDIGLTAVGADHHNTKPIRVAKGTIEKILCGVREIEAMGFHAPSIHRAARGERRGYRGWEVSYV